MGDAGNIPDSAFRINYAGDIMEKPTAFHAYGIIYYHRLFFKEYLAKVIHCLFVLLDYLFIFKIPCQSDDSF